MLIFIPRQTKSWIVYRDVLSIGVIYTDDVSNEIKFFQHSASVSYEEMIEIADRMRGMINVRIKAN